jgi:hypothetical protein
MLNIINKYRASRPRRLGNARRELQGQLVALHPAQPHPALHGARRPGARPDGWLRHHCRGVQTPGTARRGCGHQSRCCHGGAQQAGFCLHAAGC